MTRATMRVATPCNLLCVCFHVRVHYGRHYYSNRAARMHARTILKTHTIDRSCLLFCLIPFLGFSFFFHAVNESKAKKRGRTWGRWRRRRRGREMIGKCNSVKTYVTWPGGKLKKEEWRRKDVGVACKHLSKGLMVQFASALTQLLVKFKPIVKKMRFMWFESVLIIAMETMN